LGRKNLPKVPTAKTANPAPTPSEKSFPKIIVSAAPRQIASYD
jgi:hypothetical protein